MSQTNNPNPTPQGTPEALARIQRIEEILRRKNPANPQDVQVIGGTAEALFFTSSVAS
jgi:hypothetical protein